MDSNSGLGFDWVDVRVHIWVTLTFSFNFLRFVFNFLWTINLKATCFVKHFPLTPAWTTSLYQKNKDFFLYLDSNFSGLPFVLKAGFSDRFNVESIYILVKNSLVYFKSKCGKEYTTVYQPYLWSRTGNVSVTHKKYLVSFKQCPVGGPRHKYIYKEYIWKIFGVKEMGFHSPQAWQKMDRFQGNDCASH